MVKFQYICALNTGSLPNCQKIPTKTYIYISSESYQEIFPIQYLDHEIRVLMILNYVNFFFISLHSVWLTLVELGQWLKPHMRLVQYHCHWKHVRPLYKFKTWFAFLYVSIPTFLYHICISVLKFFFSGFQIFLQNIWNYSL